MPITPEEAARSRGIGGTLYDDACREIDRMLVNQQPNPSGEWAYNLNGLDQSIVIRLISIYTSYGWDVEYVSGYRPRHLVFKEQSR
jgi:hypothetical protein